MRLLWGVFITMMAAGMIIPAHSNLQAQLLPPEGLSVEMLTEPGKSKIRDRKPEFGWIVRSLDSDVLQAACQVQVFTGDESQSLSNPAVWWDSGKTESDDSVNFPYRGQPLEPGGWYAWRVRVWDGSGNVSGWSRRQGFRVTRESPVQAVSVYPLETRLVRAVGFAEKGNGCYFYDFGKAAFGTVQVYVPRREGNAALSVSLGEKVSGINELDREPPGTIRYQKILVETAGDDGVLEVKIPPDSRNTGPRAILMPDYTGEVLPFRYCEICGPGIELNRYSVVMKAVNYPFSEEASEFDCSDDRLNEVWELCKYSIKATSFAGIYVDGDRERIPYEADAYINQLGHYLTDREYSMARASHEYLLRNPTWPTEWILHSVLMAWDDFLYTGNLESAAANFEILREKTLYALAGKNGLISTTGGRVDKEILESVYLREEMRDIVDWPPGSFTDGGTGERDGHVMTDYNTVVNAFHYRAVVLFARLAEALGKTEIAEEFREKGELIKDSFNRNFLDREAGIYRDGIGTRHSSLHSNMFPLAFGLVPGDFSETVTSFVKSRGMACSVYGSQYLLDALYGAGEEQAALDLLTAEDDRSWLNMIRAGSTVTMEAWDYKYKNNLDWNHAWGAAPANLIPRWVLGVQPIEPGFRKVRVSPSPGALKWARGKVPTPRGPVEVEYSNDGQCFKLNLAIPANMEARVQIPGAGRIMLDGEPVATVYRGERSQLEIGSGRHSITAHGDGL